MCVSSLRNQSSSGVIKFHQRSFPQLIKKEKKMIPSNYHHIVQFASYSYSAHNQVPEKLKIEEDIQILTLQALPHYSLVKEYEMIAQYSDWTNSQKSKKSVVSPSSKPEAKEPLDLGSLTIEVQKTTEVTTGTQGYNSSAYILPDLSKPATSQPTNNSAQQPGGNEYLVMRMMNETGQDRDICYYLLESVNFDFNQAMEIMMQNLQVK